MPELQIFNCEQGSAEWFECRRGIPTASEFSTCLAKGEGKTRRSYMLRLAGEIITGLPAETYSNGNMVRGQEVEEEAREAYAFKNAVTLERVGFIRNGDIGCSPDSLVGRNGGLEIKTAQPNVLLDHLLRGSFPAAHRAQVQGTLLVTEREWWDLSVYWPGLPDFTVRAYRDEPYLADLRAGLRQFNDELAETVELVRTYGAKAERVAA